MEFVVTVVARAAGVMLLLAVVPVLRVLGPVEAADGVVEEEDVGTDDSVVALVWVDSVACCVLSFLII